MYFAKIGTVLASALLVSGCSFSLPSAADAEPCEVLNTVLADKLESLPTGGFDAGKLATAIGSEVTAIAPESFKIILQKVEVALTSDPVEVENLTAAATEIGMRCALVGVNVEFPNPQDLLLN